MILKEKLFQFAPNTGGGNGDGLPVDPQDEINGLWEAIQDEVALGDPNTERLEGLQLELINKIAEVDIYPYGQEGPATEQG